MKPALLKAALVIWKKDRHPPILLEQKKELKLTGYRFPIGMTTIMDTASLWIPQKTSWMKKTNS